jgi:transcriptional regulator with XRE-family HTH domain
MSMTDRQETELPEWTAGERLVKARSWAGMDQPAIARAIGKGVRSIARYENSDAPPRAIVLAYSAATGVPVWWLDGEAPPEPGQAQAADRRAARSTKWQATGGALRLAA